MYSLTEIRSLESRRLAEFVTAEVKTLVEDETLAILNNPFITPSVCQAIAQNSRLTSFYNVRLRLVALRQTPLAHAVKFVHYLYWPDLVRLSIDVTVPAAVRRSIDTQLLLGVDKLTLGQRITSARRCSAALIKAFLFDPDPKVFASLLTNQRVREDDLLLLASSSRATAEQLRLIGSDNKWSYRYAIRKALVMNPMTPRAVAAAQLRFLALKDLRLIHSRADTSVYLRRCIERINRVFAPPAVEEAP
jgi:hypothetical protein